MTVLELIRAIARDAPVGVVVTDTLVKPPGPIILYANDAFGRLTGHPPAEIVGISPRFMQGRETRRPTLDRFAQALSTGERFHGFLTNYRANGTKYVSEIDCRAIRNAVGTIDYFLAFEREVARRRGRPAVGSAGRYEPVAVSDDLLTDDLRRLGAFSR